MKKLLYNLASACLYWSSFTAIAGTNVTLDKADPAPLNSTTLPFAYVYDHGKERIRDGRSATGDGLEVSVTPFYSKASKGTDRNGLQKTELGDLSGKWNLLALLDTATPTGQSAIGLLGNSVAPGTGTLPAALIAALEYGITGSAGNANEYGQGSTPTQLESIAGMIPLQDANNEFFGFQTTAEKYCKKGARFQTTGALDCGLGVTVQLGVASISNSATFKSPVSYNYTSSTITSTTYPNSTTVVNTTTPTFLKGGVATTAENPFSIHKVTTSNWAYVLQTLDDQLIDQFQAIADAIGLDTTNFQKSGFEDLKGELFWRKAIKLEGHNKALFTPFVTVNGAFDLGEPVDQDKILSMPFGNGGHHAIGGAAGFSLDFEDNFEIGAAMGVNTYSCRRENNMRIPNSIYQNGIYPYKTAANINPGNTWYLSTFMNSYHFEEDLSFYAQYLYVSHGKDNITLVTPNSGFFPEILAAKTPWSSHMLNLGLNYDVSSGIQIGCAAQIPLKQRNAHRSSTVAISIAASL